LLAVLYQHIEFLAEYEAQSRLTLKATAEILEVFAVG
jgi:hypothetical protein